MTNSRRSLAQHDPTLKLTAKNRAASCVVTGHGLSHIRMNYNAVVVQINEATRQALEEAAELVKLEAWSKDESIRLSSMIRALAKEQAHETSSH